MGEFRTVTGASFAADVLSNQIPVVVEYWAEWCGPCRQVAPVLAALAADYAGQLDVVKVNVDENPEISQRYGILHVPTISLFSGGEVVRQVVGVRSRAALEREFAGFLS
ncbi:MAG TPA: thioredoxin [Streptosporangiaceae bacterium]|nr:thioredoxin [Streptosporangiaceae bacterium]